MAGAVPHRSSQRGSAFQSPGSALNTSYSYRPNQPLERNPPLSQQQQQQLQERVPQQQQQQHLRMDDSEDELPPGAHGMGIGDGSHQPLLMGGHPAASPHSDEGNDVFMHTVADGHKMRWSHIDDLDSFFKRVYRYHQKHGFAVMMLQECFVLFQFVFIVFWTTYLFECVDYAVLFRNSPPPRPYTPGSKVYLDDFLESPGACAAHFSFTTWIVLLIAFVFFATRSLRTFYHFFQYWDIRCFFRMALKIEDHELGSFTWHEVQRRLIVAQTEYTMCIHQDKLSDLDIYHRILRFKNYLVAMVNKDLLPCKLNVPFVGQTTLLSHGLLFNLQLILFKLPYAPFNQYHLKEDYKKSSKKIELAERLRYHILILALVNIFLMPLILLWQVLFCFFTTAELIKREPGSLGVRKWSLYSRLYLRHFNELDHELKGRLSRAYKPANKYMELFISPLIVVIANNMLFICGTILGPLLFLTAWDEDVLGVEHLITVMTVLGAAMAAFKIFVPNEYLVFCPEKSLTSVMAHIHYFPEEWKGQAHTPKVMQELGQMFPYTAAYMVQELLAPVTTPFILLFCLRPKALPIIDFFRNFTVEVTGVGDVCSFAQMDVRRHGNPKWQAPATEEVNPAPAPVAPINPEDPANRYLQAEDGKTEMSLVHFTLTNPDWKPPEDSEGFICALRDQARVDAEVLPTLNEEQMGDNCLLNSIHGLDTAGGVYSDVAGGLLTEARMSRHENAPPTNVWGSGDGGAPSLQRPHSPGGRSVTSAGMVGSVQQGLSAANVSPSRAPSIFGGGNYQESMMYNSSTSSSRFFSGAGGVPHAPPSISSSRMGGPLASLAPPPNLRQDLHRLGMEYTEADMSFSALYLHEMHHRGSVSQRRLINASRYEFNSGGQQAPQAHAQQQQHFSPPSLARRSSLNELDEDNMQPLIDGLGGSPPRLSSSNMA